MASKQYHIMMFPWLAFGHMIPFLELSKRLAAKGALISFVSTTKNLQRLPLIPSNLQPRINLVELPLPRVEGLPENCEATVDLQENQIQFLKTAYDLLAHPLENLIQVDVPDLILFDFASDWIPEIGAKFGVPTGFFVVFTAAAFAFIGPPEELKTSNRRPSPEHFTVPPDWIPFPSLLAASPDYATILWSSIHKPDATGVSTGQRMAKSIEDCSLVAFRSCDEFEGEYLAVVRELYQKPVLPIGVLPPVPEENKKEREVDSNWSDTFEWLDGQKAKPVVFVGFGSEYKMPIEQIHELAFAIELSRLPFVWILRKPQEVHSSDLLPPGFAYRTSSQGIVIQGWAPQLEILAHSAIGACLFHSGWGTIIESLGFGHPLILLPMINDQGLNAKLMVEKEVGYEVPRNEDGSFSREIVARSMRVVAVAPEGEKLRSKAAEMRRIFNNQQSEERYINKLMEHLEKDGYSKGKN
ncbi:putative UDP-rhamnose:rhamnosyltransferase 1 [Primulina huaijiensis]|uniref:putative UDP-rhamnose:rhamnosyltransferase 1 n=1 Tax=Primulina huaijiensis TaxID=1492673 RepID=UPI003CC7333B